MENVYHLLRHGQSLADEASLLVSHPKSFSSFGLTDKGREQVRNVAMKSNLPSDTIVVSSPLLSARESSDIFREIIGCPEVRVGYDLMERRFWELEGESNQKLLSVWETDSKQYRGPRRDAEAPISMANRVFKISYKLDAAFTKRQILIVSHSEPLHFFQLLKAGHQLTEHHRFRRMKPGELRLVHDLPCHEGLETTEGDTGATG